MIHMYIIKERLSSSHRRIILYITNYILRYIYLMYSIIEFVIFICYAHHTPLRSHFADSGHTFVAKRQVHSRHCGQDNTSTIFKWMKIIDNVYYNYYHFPNPSTLLTENNTMIIT